MNTPWQSVAQAPLALVYVAMIVLQRHRVARIGATMTLLGALVGACAFTLGGA